MYAVLQQPRLAGWPAFMFALAAIAAPTLCRASVNGPVSGSEFIPYVPSTVVAACVLRRSHAFLTALGSAFAANLVLFAPRFQLSLNPSALFGAGVFLASSTLIIGVLWGFRRLLHDAVAPNAAVDRLSEVLFSEKEGHAWAHWYADRPLFISASQNRSLR